MKLENILKALKYINKGNTNGNAAAKSNLFALDKMDKRYERLASIASSEWANETFRKNTEYVKQIHWSSKHMTYNTKGIFRTLLHKGNELEVYLKLQTL